MRCRQGLSSLLRIIYSEKLQPCKPPGCLFRKRPRWLLQGRAFLVWLARPTPPPLALPLSSRTLLVDVITWYCMSDVCLGVSGITDREVFTCVSISGVDETPLSQKMTEFSPTMLNVSTVSTRTALRYERGRTGMLPPLQQTDREHINLRRTLKTRHHTQTSQQIPPKGGAGGDFNLSDASLYASVHGPTLALPSHLQNSKLCRCGLAVWWWMSSSLSEGLAAAGQIQFNPAHFHQCAVLPRVVLLVRVWCVVLQ